MAYKISIQPTEEVITLAEAKNQLQIDDFDVDDSLITDLIKAVRQDTELHLNQCLVTQTVQEYYKAWEDDEHFQEKLTLSLSPVQSISSITYSDATGNTQTLATYQSELIGIPSTIYAAVGAAFPSVQSGAINPIKVTYVAGYGLATDVPKPIKQAMLLMIRSYYDNRHDSVRNMPTASQSLLSKYRVKMY